MRLLMFCCVHKRNGLNLLKAKIIYLENHFSDIHKRCFRLGCYTRGVHKVSFPTRPTAINPYSAKGLGDWLYAILHKMPGEVGYTFCLFLSLKTLPYTHLEAISYIPQQGQSLHI